MRGERRSTWWVVFTFVPFGWLAFVSFWYAGKRAGRRDWLAWAVFYFVAFWGGTIVAGAEGIDEGVREAVGGAVFIGTLVPLIHALAIRRAYLEAPEPEEHRPPEGWKRLRTGARTTGIWTLASGASLVVGGLAAIVRGDPGFGVAGAGMGASLCPVAALLLPRRRLVPPIASAYPGMAEAGLVFRHSPARVWGAVAAAASFGIGMAGFAVWPEEFTPGSDASRAVGLGGVVLAGASALIAARRLHRSALVLTPRGVRSGGARPRSFVPWSAIGGVRAAGAAMGEPLIAIDVSDPAAVEGGPRRRRPQEITYSTRVLETEPGWVLATIRHYWQHPEEREELGTRSSVDKFDDLVRGEAQLFSDRA